MTKLVDLSPRCRRLYESFEEEMEIFHELMSDEMGPGTFRVEVDETKIALIGEGETFEFVDERSRPAVAAFKKFTQAMESEGHDPAHLTGDDVSA